MLILFFLMQQVPAYNKNLMFLKVQCILENGRYFFNNFRKNWKYLGQAKSFGNKEKLI